MKTWIKALINSLGLLTLAVLVTACGGGGGGGSKEKVLEGTAATGAAISGFVYLQDKNGQPGNGVPYTINADGSFSIDVSDFSPPFMLKAASNDGLITEFSWADAAGTVNITPMTTLALFEASGRDDLEEVFNNWATRNGDVDPGEVQQTANALVESFREQLEAAGINVKKFDVFSSSFAADNTGFDAVLDDTTINIDLNSGTVTVNGQQFDISDSIDQGDIGQGDWTLTITGSVQSNGITTSIPASTIEGVEAANVSHVEEAFENFTATQGGSSISCQNVSVTVLDDTSTRKSFRAEANCDFSSQGISMSYGYNLTYTYTR